MDKDAWLDTIVNKINYESKLLLWFYYYPQGEIAQQYFDNAIDEMCENGTVEYLDEDEEA